MRSDAEPCEDTTRIKRIEISCFKNGWIWFHAGEVKVHRNKWMVLQNGSVGLGHIRHGFYREISWNNTMEKQNDEGKNKQNDDRREIEFRFFLHFFYIIKYNVCYSIILQAGVEWKVHSHTSIPVRQYLGTAVVLTLTLAWYYSCNTMFKMLMFT